MVSNENNLETGNEQGFESAKEMQALADLRQESEAAMASKRAADAARAEQEKANSEENVTDPNVIKSNDVPFTREATEPAQPNSLIDSNDIPKGL